VVGSIGSGKSTLAHLLARLYRPESGEIRIGGRGLDGIPRRDLRGGLGLAPQEPFLFSRSLRDNVAMGMNSPEPGRIDEAGRIASLESDLADMPDGWDTVVGERGYTLSGGQRQRAALARALAPRPRILVLDDSLSSLDAETEKTVLDRMRDETRDRTVILISHRLTSVLGADRIFVLDGGRLVEEGPPDELLNRGRVFPELFRQQRLGLETSR
jgi:ATP-binding cassette subfamily B protein